MARKQNESGKTSSEKPEPTPEQPSQAAQVDLFNTDVTLENIELPQSNAVAPPVVDEGKSVTGAETEIQNTEEARDLPKLPDALNASEPLIEAGSEAGEFVDEHGDRYILEDGEKVYLYKDEDEYISRSKDREAFAVVEKVEEFSIEFAEHFRAKAIEDPKKYGRQLQTDFIVLGRAARQLKEKLQRLGE